MHPPQTPPLSSPPLSSPPLSSPPLGSPLPSHPHAVSVALPLWRHVVGYEEGCPLVTSRLSLGYPRFVYHPYVRQLLEATTRRAEAAAAAAGGPASLDCLVLPSRAAADRCRDFLVRAVPALDQDPNEQPASHDNAVDLPPDPPGADLASLFSSQAGGQAGRKVKVLDLGVGADPALPAPPPPLSGNVHAVVFPRSTELAVQAKSYWQHTGEVLSSRRAEAALRALGHPVAPVTVSCPSSPPSAKCEQSRPLMAQHPPPMPQPKEPHGELVKDLARLSGQPEGHVFLAPSGMQAIHAALRLSRRRRLDAGLSGGNAVVFGFPYLDTLKMCGRPELSDGVDFLGFGDARDLDMLRFMLKSRAQSSGSNDAGVAAVFTEFPSNPLLQAPDLGALRELADEYGFLLVADDTIGTFANVDLLSSGAADVICTSLTKLYSGSGNVMAGSCIVGSTNPGSAELARLMREVHGGNTGDLYGLDAGCLVNNARDFEDRNRAINETAERLAGWLGERAEVKQVYYPNVEAENRARFEKYLKPGGGFGSLLSIVLNESTCEQTMYDHLSLCKGPSLGTNFTLVCPYTLLAHFHELEFARAYGVSPNLLRIAVGLEPFDQIKSTFEEAFEVAHAAKQAAAAGAPRAVPLQALGGVRQFGSAAGGRGGAGAVRSFGSLARGAVRAAPRQAKGAAAVATLAATFFGLT